MDHGLEHQVVGAAPGQVVGDLGRDLAYDLDRRARRFDSDMTVTGTAGEALAIASAAMAASVVETTLSALLDDLGSRQLATPAVRAEDKAEPDRAVRNRSAMVMPYFSTNGGLARTHRE